MEGAGRTIPDDDDDDDDDDDGAAAIDSMYALEGLLWFDLKALRISTNSSC